MKFELFGLFSDEVEGNGEETDKKFSEAET
jgi:hypothetical protein